MHQRNNQPAEKLILMIEARVNSFMSCDFSKAQNTFRLCPFFKGHEINDDDGL
jgi:hypothetical protein